VPDPPSARDLRVSDDERRHVVGLLERATGRGLIDLTEFTARVDTALAARTRGELNAVLVDLPGLVHPDRPAAAAPRTVAAPVTRPAPGPAPGPAADPDPDGRAALSTAFGSIRRRGAWTVPERLAVTTQLGSVDLDFTETDVPPVVDIALDVVGGSVEVRVPAAARVEHGGLAVLLGSVEDHRRDGRGAGPVFVLHGRVRAGSVEVRGPRRTRWWPR
jgi:hypothetical protein